MELLWSYIDGHNNCHLRSNYGLMVGYTEMNGF